MVEESSKKKDFDEGGERQQENTSHGRGTKRSSSDMCGQSNSSAPAKKPVLQSSTKPEDCSEHNETAHLITSPSCQSTTIVTDSLSLSEVQNLSRSFIGGGGSGNVFEATWRGLKVAIKEWNGCNDDECGDLKREISILRSMKKHCPHLFGTVIPKMYLNYIPTPEEERIGREPMLVTDFIGEQIFRGEAERLLLVMRTTRSR